MIRQLAVASALVLVAVSAGCGSDPGPSRDVTGTGGTGVTPAGTGGATDGGTDISISPDASGTGGIDGSQPAMTIAEACAFAAKVRCQRYESCVPYFFQAFYGDQAFCQEHNTAACAQAKGLPGSNTKPSDIVACTQANQAANCDDWQDNEEYATNVPTACKTIPGTVATGTACAVNEQCMSRYCARGAGDDACGVCTAKLALGGDCTANIACVDGAACNNGKCAPTVGAGMSCIDDVDCVDGLFCSKNKCGKGDPVGAACQFSSDCATHVTCRNKKCERVGKAGDPCSIDPANGADSCGEDSQCGPANTCVIGRVVKSGQACDQSNLVFCDRDSICDEGSETCVPLVAIGASCRPDDPCVYPAECITGKCLIRDLSACK